MSRINQMYRMPFEKVYQSYVQKVERKNRTQSDVDEIITWLMGYSEIDIRTAINQGVDVRGFFEQAPVIHPNSVMVTGRICGILIEDIEDPLMKKIRILDKLIDELAKGKSLEKIKRK